MRRFCLAILLVLVSASCGKKETFLVNNDPNADGPPAGQDGAACTSNRACDGGTCISFTEGWRGGYCTTVDCAGGCNGDDATCIPFLDGSSFCMDGCESSEDCRIGYRCRALDATGARVCYRDDNDGPAAGEIGSDCVNDGDCRHGAKCDTSVPGGYCLNDCDSCDGALVCTDWNGSEQCVAGCETTRQCRTGYICNGTYCEPGQPVTPPFDFDVTRDVLGVSCNAVELGDEGFGTKWTIDYEVPPGSAGYMVVPFVQTGTLRPTSIALPSGGAIDLVEDYKHHNIRVTEFQFFDQESEGTFGEVALDWPILVPYSPERADLLESGTHTMELITSLDQPCVYVMSTDGGGTVLDLNVIFMGLEGYDAASAPTDPDLQQVFSAVESLLSSAGVTVGDVKYYDAPNEIAERYAYVRSEIEMRRATGFGVPRDETLNGHLNVDMFLVEDMQLGGGGKVLGLSAGLPGPPGLHGNPANGLVFTGADIGSDNVFVAHIMAHELGHYLGLRHTTEVVHNLEQGVELNALLGTTDPIEDTPVCDAPLFQGEMCPDAANLMFPSAPRVAGSATVTEGQAAVLRANPLFKVE